MWGMRWYVLIVVRGKMKIKTNRHFDAMKSTLEVLSDPELMEQIKESKEDYKAGRYKKLRDLINET